MNELCHQFQPGKDGKGGGEREGREREREMVDKQSVRTFSTITHCLIVSTKPSHNQTL